MAATTLNSGEEAQLHQTIEMFEVIVQSQPLDTQSLEILKEAYSKLGREKDVVGTSKRIAQAYLQQGQLSSAILEYETVLQRSPDDADVRAALKQIEEKASRATAMAPAEIMPPPSETAGTHSRGKGHGATAIEDGRKTMHRLFVESKLITAGDFDLCWHKVDMDRRPSGPVEPFIQTLHERGVYLLEKSLRLVAEKSRVPFLPLDRYDVDMDLARGFPADVCRRWCVFPFDRMSKAILVATANPFNQEAAKELAGTTTHRILWYLVSPADITANLRKAFR